MIKKLVLKLKNFIYGLTLTKDEKHFANEVYKWDYVKHVEMKKLSVKLEKEGRLTFTEGNSSIDNNLDGVDERFIVFRNCPIPFFYLEDKAMMTYTQQTSVHLIDNDVINNMNKAINKCFSNEPSCLTTKDLLECSGVYEKYMEELEKRKLEEE